MVMPGEGAVWPATVIKGERMVSMVRSRISPLTSKTQVRGVRMFRHARSVPRPESARLRTRTTRVAAGERCLPLPPIVVDPKPTTPGIAASVSASAEEGRPRGWLSEGTGSSQARAQSAVDRALFLRYLIV